MNASLRSRPAASRRWHPRGLLTAAFTGLAALTSVAVLPAQPGQERRAPQLPTGCEALQVPAGHVVSQHAFARGVQIWRWDAAASTWVFVAPAAILYADAGGHGVLGVHFGGPTWTSVSGSSVMGRVVASCTVDASAVPWLLLEAVAPQGPGPFARTTYIQRVHTTGGRAPLRPGVANEVVQVPYTAEYWFYRAR